MVPRCELKPARDNELLVFLCIVRLIWICVFVSLRCTNGLICSTRDLRSNYIEFVFTAYILKFKSFPRLYVRCPPNNPWMLCGSQLGNDQLWCGLFPARSKRTENVSTVGVDVSEWVYSSQGGYVFKNNRTSVTFSTWDFGGQVNECLFACLIRFITSRKLEQKWRLLY